MMFLTVSGYVYFFVPNIVQSTLFSEQHSLFDARDINKKKNKKKKTPISTRVQSDLRQCQHFF